MINLKVGDYVVAVDNITYDFATDTFFIIKNKRYLIVDIILEEYDDRQILVPTNLFVIIDETGLRHRFGLDNINDSGGQYIFDTVHNYRIKKIKTLYQ